MSIPLPTLLTVLVVGGAGCAPLAPPTPSPLALAVRYAQTTLAAPDGGAGQHLGIAVLAVPRPPAGAAIEAVAARLTSEHGLPFRAASPLPAGSRWLDSAAVADLLYRQQLGGSTPLPSRAVADAVLSPQWETRIDIQGLPGLRLHWRDAGDGPRLFLVIDHADATQRHSTVAIAEPFAQGPAALFVAAPGSGFAGHAIVLSPGGAAEPASVARIAAARTATAAPSSPLPAPVRAALAAVGAHPRRAALLGLARPLGAPRALDLLLVADEPALIAITGALAADPAIAAAAWSFERAVWLALLPLAERGELSLALQAAFARHLGAVADDTATLRALLTSADDVGAFVAALRRENEYALADRSTASRCAGHDWLLRHGGAIADYDPLAAPAARQQALRRHSAARCAAEADR